MITSWGILPIAYKTCCGDWTEAVETIGDVINNLILSWQYIRQTKRISQAILFKQIAPYFFLRRESKAREAELFSLCGKLCLTHLYYNT